MAFAVCLAPCARRSAFLAWVTALAFALTFALAAAIGRTVAAAAVKAAFSCASWKDTLDCSRAQASAAGRSSRVAAETEPTSSAQRSVKRRVQVPLGSVRPLKAPVSDVATPPFGVPPGAVAK